MTEMRTGRFLIFLLIFFAAGCTSTRQIPDFYLIDGKMDLLLPGKYVDDSSGEAVTSQVFRTVEKPESSSSSSLMEAETDSNGETTIRDTIATSFVTARFSHAAERMGMIDIEFIIRASSGFFNGGHQLRLYPRLTYLQDTLFLDRVFFTNDAYRSWQEEGYAKYEKYKNSIIRDSVSFLQRGMIDRFMSRNGRFVGEKEAADHYVRWWKRTYNYRLAEMEPEMFIKYVPCPIETENVRVDSVVRDVRDGDVFYTYKYSLKTLPKMKSVQVFLDGEVFDTDGTVYELQSPEPLTYYVNSIATLARDRTLAGGGEKAELYACGLQKLKDMEYGEAAEYLKPFKDYNAALALIGNFKNYSALQILNSLASESDVEYLKAIVYMRLQREDSALNCYKKACRGNKFYISRGNLDYEIQALKQSKHIDDNLLYDE